MAPLISRNDVAAATFAVVIVLFSIAAFKIARKEPRNKRTVALQAVKRYNVKHPKRPQLYARRWFEQKTMAAGKCDMGIEASITFVQFNILADGLSGRDVLTNKGGFTECPVEALDFSYRIDRIIEELVRHGTLPDVVAMEEVDHFEEILAELKLLGYDGVYQAKPDSPCKRQSGDPNLEDGCALFWLADRFNVPDGCFWTFTYDEVDQNTGEKTGEKSNQIAILVELKPSSERLPALLVGCTHLKATKKSAGERKRVVQVQQLLDFVVDKRMKRSGGTSPVVLCMDMNAVPIEQGHEYPSEALPTALNHTGISLRSAYATALGGKEPAWSTWKVRKKSGDTIESKHTIDYILHSPELRVKKVLLAPDDEVIGEGRLPDWSYPSDHIALAAEFTLPTE